MILDIVKSVLSFALIVYAVFILKRWDDAGKMVQKAIEKLMEDADDL